MHLFMEVGFGVQGDVTSLNQQIRNFEKVTLPDLEAQLGVKSSESLSSYLFVVGVGGNDITFNYFLHAINSNISLQAFTITMTTLLSAQLKVQHLPILLFIIGFTFLICFLIN